MQDLEKKEVDLKLHLPELEKQIHRLEERCADKDRHDKHFIYNTNVDV